MNLSGKLLRTVRPSATVRRHVQGVDLLLPRSHMLPDYAERFPQYGQNLVALAKHLTDGEPLRVIDVGANIGDSALQILNVTDARVLCLEGDGYWADYLRRNVSSEARVTVEQSLLTPRSDSTPFAPMRSGGTTRFSAGASTDTASAVTATELRARHPEFASVRLIKSDTDGFDVLLIPALAAEWARSRPVLFFEYDHELSAKAGVREPRDVWGQLAALGYEMVGVWDNYGNPLEALPIAKMSEAATRMDVGRAEGRWYYWDVAVAHSADPRSCEVVRQLCGG